MSIGGWGATTDRGLRREVNEDALLADPPLFVVADGMGGHAAGDVASGMAIDVLAGLVGERPISPQDAIDAIQQANGAIFGLASSSPGKAGMGTTISGIASVVTGGSEHWMVFNVGDSRVYRLSYGRLTQLTVDHSEAEEMVAAGLLTREQGREYEHRNVVTRSLGTTPGVDIDSWVFPPIGSERFLVCSDGLTTEVTDDRIRACLLDNPDPQAAAATLVQLALEGGGHDNVTALVVDAAPSAVAADEDTSPRGRSGVR